MEIRELGRSDIDSCLLLHFSRYQRVTQCWRKHENNWQLENCAYIRDWDEDKKKWAVAHFVSRLQEGGALIGSFEEGHLVGFALLSGALSGTACRYINLEMLMISHGCRHRGIGAGLFHSACQKALELEADKLFISAHPAADVIAFYQKMGCRNAAEVIPAFVDTAEDWLMEYPLRPI